MLSLADRPPPAPCGPPGQPARGGSVREQMGTGAAGMGDQAVADRKEAVADRKEEERLRLIKLARSGAIMPRQPYSLDPGLQDDLNYLNRYGTLPQMRDR